MNTLKFVPNNNSQHYAYGYCVTLMSFTTYYSKQENKNISHRRIHTHTRQCTTSQIRIRISFNNSLLVAEIFTLYKINTACVCIMCLCIQVVISGFASFSLIPEAAQIYTEFLMFLFHQFGLLVRFGLSIAFYFIMFIFHFILFFCNIYIWLSILFNIIVISMLLFLSGMKKNSLLFQVDWTTTFRILMGFVWVQMQM